MLIFNCMITFVGLVKQLEYLLTDEWIKKMWYIYTMEYYSATEKNEIMPLATTRIDLEIIILNEIRDQIRSDQSLSHVRLFATP